MYRKSKIGVIDVISGVWKPQKIAITYVIAIFCMFSLPPRETEKIIFFRGIGASLKITYTSVVFDVAPGHVAVF